MKTNIFPWGKAPHRGRARGQSLLEFALVIPVLMIIMAGVTEFGLFFMVSHTVQNASREGAREAVVLPDLIANDPRVIGHIDDLLPDGGLFSGFSGGITNSGITDCDVTDQVNVNISGTYNFSAMRILGFESMNMSYPTTMRYELCE